MMWREWLLVAGGGAIGCVMRHAVNTFVQARFPDSHLPWHTLLVNVSGCFLIGVVLQAVQSSVLAAPVRHFLVTGLLGGLTTFSTFGYDTWRCWEFQGARLALLNLAANVVLGLLAVVLGVSVGRRW